jgi:ribosomal protein S18 acetylase RimI-like enzyme
MDVDVRPVAPEEYAEAGRITAQAYAGDPEAASPTLDYLDRVADVATRSAHALVLGAFRGGRPVGSVTLELDDRIPGGHPRPPLRPDEGHVRMLGVDPAFQRRGIARLLMWAAIEEARRAGKRRVTLETTGSMVPAHRLYESMGFVRGSDMVFDDGFRLRTYELAL